MGMMILIFVRGPSWSGCLLWPPAGLLWRRRVERDLDRAVRRPLPDHVRGLKRVDGPLPCRKGCATIRSSPPSWPKWRIIVT